jgi:cytochrome c-type biogenesis protein CcmE
MQMGESVRLYDKCPIPAVAFVTSFGFSTKFDHDWTRFGLDIATLNPVTGDVAHRIPKFAKERQMASVLQNPPAKPVARTTGIPLKFILGGIVLLGVIAFVMFSSFQSNTVYYYTLSELYAQRTELTGRTVRVNAPLDKTSIQNDQKNLVLQFNLVDGDYMLPVVYRGVAPDTMSTGETVVAEGKLDSNGVFQADSILVKCPSKYEKSTEQ